MGVHETFGDAECRVDALEATTRQSDPKVPNSTKKNHFVPCFYSSLWTGGDGRLCEFSRPYDRVKPRRKHPDATGYSIDLYTEAALPDGPRTYLEDSFLKLVDQRACDALRVMLTRHIDDLKPEQRVAWTRFMMSMLQRSPGKVAELRRRWRSEYRKPHPELEQQYRERRAATDPPTLSEFLEQTGEEALGHGQVRVLQMVMDLPKVGLQVVNMTWGVLTIPDIPVKLLTSDRPIIKTNGIGKPEAYVTVPIGPRKLFFAANERSTIDWIKAQPASELIRNVNATVVAQAENYVYGEFDYLRNFVEKHMRRRQGS